MDRNACNRRISGNNLHGKGKIVGMYVIAHLSPVLHVAEQQHGIKMILRLINRENCV